MNIKNSVIFNQKFTFGILLFLLFIRIMSIDGVAWIFSGIPYIWISHCFYAGTYILTAVVIYVNKNNLEDLHMDKTFIQIFPLDKLSMHF